MTDHEHPPNTPLIDLDWSEWEEKTGAAYVALRSPRAERITMDDYGLELAAVVAKRAACTRRQVGAVIIDANKRIAATGYNGSVAGAPHCTDGGCPRGAYTHDQIPKSLGNGGHEVPCIALHAERNAMAYVLHTYRDPDSVTEYLRQCTLYITTAPCPDCESMANGLVGRTVWPW